MTMRAPRYALPLGLLTIVALSSAAFWPGLSADLALDDFFLTAMSRLVGDPLAFLGSNQFPGGVFYRPLGMVLWWASVETVGINPVWQHVINLVIHIGISLAFWRLLRLWSGSEGIALACAVFFAVHPISVGTTLGPYDRFDLLCVLFAVLAIDGALRYRRGLGNRWLVAGLAWTSMSVLSKESGYATFVAVGLLWLWPLRQPVQAEHPSTAQRWRALLALVAVCVVLVALRQAILGDKLQRTLLHDAPLLRTLVEGLRMWLNALPAYISQWPRLNGMERTVMAVAFAGGGLASIVLWKKSRPHAGLTRAEGLMSCVLATAFTVAAALTQAPIVRRTPLALGPDDGAVWTSANARFYYLSLIGITLLIATIAVLLQHSGSVQASRRHRVIAFLASAFLIAPLGMSAYALADGYRTEARVQMTLLSSATQAVAALRLPAEACQVYFLGVPADQSFLFSVNIDGAVKALTPDIDTVGHCLFQTEATPWFQIVRRGRLEPTTVAPLQPMLVAGRVEPWPAYGRLQIAYLNIPARTDPTTMRSARFLAYDDGRFVEVSDEVLDGRRKVAFHCFRIPRECAELP